MNSVKLFSHFHSPAAVDYRRQTSQREGDEMVAFAGWKRQRDGGRREGGGVSAGNELLVAAATFGWVHTRAHAFGPFRRMPPYSQKRPSRNRIVALTGMRALDGIQCPRGRVLDHFEPGESIMPVQNATENSFWRPAHIFNRERINCAGYQKTLAH